MSHVGAVPAGDAFADAAVAEAYVHRPDYADGIYRKLVEISPGFESLLDLGCGTGKISRRLADRFASVTAVDPSEEMLRVARTQPSGDRRNIRWVPERAEEAPFEGAPFDLVVAGASIHWMDHATVFPKLLASARADHLFAAVDGDGAFDPAWRCGWDDFLARWIYELTGEAYEPDRPDSAFARRMNRYRNWLNVSGEEAFMSEPIQQRVEDFIACQHSRATFAPARLGARVNEFDRQLAGVLEPHAVAGVVTFTIQSRIVWGTIRAPSS